MASEEKAFLALRTVSGWVLVCETGGSCGQQCHQDLVWPGKRPCLLMSLYLMVTLSEASLSWLLRCLFLMSLT